MRRLLLFLPLLLLSGCGDKSSTEPNPPTEMSITLSPSRVLLDIGQRQTFTANVYGSSNINVFWRVQDIVGGAAEYGTIDTTGRYRAPVSEPDVDSVKITAVADADTTVKADAWAIIVDPAKIYVSESGSDTEGVGSRYRPYRTITFGLLQATANQTVIVMAGVYNAGTGEEFPLVVPAGVTLQGKGGDSTYVVGLGGSRDQSGAVVLLSSFPATVEKFNISTADQNGVGVWVLPGQLMKVKNNFISQNYAGVVCAGTNLPRSLIESNTITGDTIGIMTTESSEPILRNNVITFCGSIGVHVLDSSRPDLGTVDSTDAGGNTIRDCGPGNQWLLKNESPDTIWAVGNEWQFTIPENNDQFIYDDEESGGTSGPVLLVNQ